ncbi:MAG: hypothetical protein QM504_01580 [Pseudomonadota bacterium]
MNEIYEVKYRKELKVKSKGCVFSDQRLYKAYVSIGISDIEGAINERMLAINGETIVCKIESIVSTNNLLLITGDG